MASNTPSYHPTYIRKVWCRYLESVRSYSPKIIVTFDVYNRPWYDWPGPYMPSYHPTHIHNIWYTIHESVKSYSRDKNNWLWPLQLTLTLKRMTRLWHATHPLVILHIFPSFDTDIFNQWEVKIIIGYLLVKGGRYFYLWHRKWGQNSSSVQWSFAP